MLDAGLEGLASARLVLRRYTLDDLDELHRLNSDERVMRYLGGVVSREATREMLEGRILRYYNQHPGLGAWACLEKSSGTHIGFHLLNHIQGERHVQVGYRLFPEYWGRGYATEMSIALLRYGYEQLRLPQLVAITALENANSQNVLLKSGLHRKGEKSLAHPSYSAYGSLAWFERDAAEWLREQGQHSQ